MEILKFNEDFPIFYTGTEGDIVKNKRVISNYRFPATMKGQPVDVPGKHMGTTTRKAEKGWFVLFDDPKFTQEVEVFNGEITFV